MVVVLGTGEHDRLLYRDFDAYYRAVRRRFVGAARLDQADLSVSGRPLRPVRVHGALRAALARRRSPEPGRRHPPRSGAEAERGGRSARSQLSAIDPARRIGIGASDARAACGIRLPCRPGTATAGEHRYELLPVDERTGFRLLPQPSPGDIFFDMEGDPYFSPDRGLEYLFGVMTVDGGAAALPCLSGARPPAGEGRVRAVRRLRSRAPSTQWPDLHVYHYAAYEPSALKRLMSEHATREDELDDLLRREVFVDLYQVVRQSIRISHAELLDQEGADVLHGGTPDREP